MIGKYEKLENSEIQSEERIPIADERSDENALSGLHEILTQEQIEFLDNERLWGHNQVRLHEIIVLMRRKIENSQTADPSLTRKLEIQGERIRLKEQVEKCDRNFKLVMFSVALIAIIILALLGCFSAPS